VIVDTSALLAVFFDEPERDEFSGRSPPPRLSVGAPTLAETALVVAARLERQGFASSRSCRTCDLIVVPSTVALAVAAAAWFRFGRGRHRAALNSALSHLRDRTAGRAPAALQGRRFARQTSYSPDPSSSAGGRPEVRAVGRRGETVADHVFRVLTETSVERSWIERSTLASRLPRRRLGPSPDGSVLVCRCGSADGRGVEVVIAKGDLKLALARDPRCLLVVFELFDFRASVHAGECSMHGRAVQSDRRAYLGIADGRVFSRA